MEADRSTHAAGRLAWAEGMEDAVGIVGMGGEASVIGREVCVSVCMCVC